MLKNSQIKLLKVSQVEISGRSGVSRNSSGKNSNFLPWRGKQIPKNCRVPGHNLVPKTCVASSKMSLIKIFEGASGYTIHQLYCYVLCIEELLWDIRTFRM
jgi:hypothetical protein